MVALRECFERRDQLIREVQRADAEHGRELVGGGVMPKKNLSFRADAAFAKPEIYELRSKRIRESVGNFALNSNRAYPENVA
jgi:hypothetical protein